MAVGEKLPISTHVLQPMDRENSEIRRLLTRHKRAKVANWQQYIHRNANNQRFTADGRLSRGAARVVRYATRMVYLHRAGTVVERPFEGQGSCLTPIHIYACTYTYTALPAAFATYLYRAAVRHMWVRLSGLRHAFVQSTLAIGTFIRIFPLKS